MQSSKAPEDSFDDPETCENSVYTDDYQTEDAFAQIPASNEFVEEETQEISSIEEADPKPNRPPYEAFPAIQKLETFRPKPEKRQKSEERKREKVREGVHRLKVREKKKSFRKPVFAELFSCPAFKTFSSVVRKSSRQIITVVVGSAVLSGCLLILGFVSLHA